MTPQQEAIFSCVLRGEAEALEQLLQDVDDLEERLSGADEVGRSALLVGGLLGRTAIVSELVKHGAPVNQQTSTGYTALHLASCWGHVDTVQTLLKLRADYKIQNFRGERPIDLAKKYSRQDCVNCLLLEEAEQGFASYLAHIKGVISESESCLTKEERNLWARLLAANMEWLRSVTDRQVLDYTNQRRDLDESLEHILNKLANAR
ncbi:ankyrin repeat domain-containing protein 45 [Eucyclogobius newberryi]|uniref:ankyrin repeat domain-containing protein 45-like n=1 Tax=Eucyclogobius newberryi TaxID=166745 RepID=UPI003B596783